MYAGPALNPRSAAGNKGLSATRDRHSRGPDAPRNPDTYPARRCAVVGAFARPVAQPAWAALHHRHHAGRSEIDACSKIIALKVFSGEKLATIYFWRAVGWNKKGNYAQVIADAGEAIRLQPSVAAYNLRGSAYYDKGEYDIAIADFNDALRIGPPSGIIFHNRGNAWRGKGEYAKAIADYDQSIRLGPPSAFSWQNRGISKRGARRSRRRAGRHQRSDPARPGIAAAADQPRGDLARQGRSRSRHRRRHRGDPARQGKGAGQHHDAARQRADLGLHAIAPSPTRPRAISTAPSWITPRRCRVRLPTPAARPTRPPQRFACRCCQRRCRPRRERQPQRHRRRPAKPRRLRRQAPRARPRPPRGACASAQRPTEKPADASRW